MEERKDGRSSDEVVGEIPLEWPEDSLPPIDIPMKHEDPGPSGTLGVSKERRQADTSHLMEVESGGRSRQPGLGVHVDGEPSGHDAMRRRIDRFRRDDHG